MSLKLFEKPEGVGAEMNTSADGDSSVMLRLDGMEGIDAQHRKPF